MAVDLASLLKALLVRPAHRRCSQAWQGPSHQIESCPFREPTTSLILSSHMGHSSSGGHLELEPVVFFVGIFGRGDSTWTKMDVDSRQQLQAEPRCCLSATIVVAETKDVCSFLQSDLNRCHNKTATRATRRPRLRFTRHAFTIRFVPRTKECFRTKPNKRNHIRPRRPPQSCGEQPPLPNLLKKPVHRRNVATGEQELTRPGCVTCLALRDI